MRLNNFINESSQTDPYQIVVDVYNRSLPYIMDLIKEFHHIDLKTPMLLSGRNSNDTIINKSIRTDRYPKDTPPELHDFVDNLFGRFYGINARSGSVFVTGKYNTAKSYGDSLYGIFPNGNDYNILWSDSIHDLYSDELENRDYRYIGWSVDDVTNDLLLDWDDNSDAKEYLESKFDEDNKVSDFEDEDEYIDARDAYVDDNIEEEMYDRVKKYAEELLENAEEGLESLIRYDYQKGNLKKAILSGNEIMLSGRSYTGIRYDYLPYVLRYMEVHKTKKPTPHLFETAMVGADFRKFPKSNVSPEGYRKRLAKSILVSIDLSDLKK